MPLHSPFTEPGYYRIEVRGVVHSNQCSRFGAMQVGSRNSADGSAATSLQGRVRDQAELAGILNTLYELHVTLLAVHYLGDEALPDTDLPNPPGS